MAPKRKASRAERKAARAGDGAPRKPASGPRRSGPRPGKPAPGPRPGKPAPPGAKGPRKPQKKGGRTPSAEVDPELVEGPPPERRERRALSHVGGRVVVDGAEGALAEALTDALDIPRDDASGRAHVHG